MRFVLRYWTRRSASTIALPSAVDPDAIRDTACRLRELADEHEWQIYGEAFIRFRSRCDIAVHLPVRLESASPPAPVLVGRVDHGFVVAAYDVPFAEAWRVATAMTRYIGEQVDMAGLVEYHFDPSVGRTEGIVVAPVVEHPPDKAAFITPLDAVTG